MKLTDEMIAKAAKDYEQSTLDSLSFTEHAFSPAFERRMKRLIRRQEQSAGCVYFRRAVCASLAIVLCVGAFLMLHPEARAAVVQWVKERFESLTYYYSSGDVEPTTDQTDALPTSYDFGWLPEGYTLYLRVDQENDGSIIYENESGDFIYLNYYNDNWDGKSAFTYEGGSYKTVTVNGRDAELFIEDDINAGNYIVWTSEDNRVMFQVFGRCEEDILIRLAENVIPVDPDADQTEPLPTSYELGWLPEGYVFYTRVDQETGGSVYYQNESGYYIVLTYLYDYEDGMIAILHETSTLKKVTVNGCDADLYLEEDPAEASSLVWIGKDNRELFTVIGVCEEDVLIKIAENVISVQQ